MSKSEIMTLKKAVALLILFIIVSTTLHLNYQDGASRAKKGLEASLTRATMLARSKVTPIDNKELIITALTLFGSAKHPGEAYLDKDIQAQLAVLDSARNRARTCGTSFADEFLKFGYESGRNKYVAMYSVWENGGPKIGYSDLERFSKALEQARRLILLSRTTLADKKITHYHQEKMKSPPEWSKTFRPTKKAGGNSFYQETLESGSYCRASVPKAIPVPVNIKPSGKKVRKGRSDVVAYVDTMPLLERLRDNYRREASSNMNNTGENHERD